ncbi:hypothetical protein ACI5KX_00180 [Erythrobacter sp. GH1-10]|uniref:hypothetical protein n=1 Tax=Erythrobacter sp. GH1-10 TaxID=3349334 RepID=UPI003877E462
MFKGHLVVIAGATLLAGCGSETTENDAAAAGGDQPVAASDQIDTRVAEEFFADLPRASEVPETEMGDVYFKLLTRLTSKLDAVKDEGDLENARAYLHYARMEAATLADRSEALPIERRKELFQDSVATVNYARSQYARALKKLEREHPSLAEGLGELASAKWPLLSTNR